jgi:glycosyltransferase involved in cell wall biosynthesis
VSSRRGAASPQATRISSLSTVSRRPRVLAAIKERGLPHSPWMWSQISNMPSLDLRVMYWMPADAQATPQTSVPVDVLEAAPTPYDGRGRWRFRAANLSGRNFYAARGNEEIEIRQLISSLNPSAILCYYGSVALRIVDIAYELGIPTIAYFHGDFRWDLERNRWYRWSLSRRLERFAEIVVVNDEEKAWVLKAGAPPEKIHVIPCGASTAFFSPGGARHDGLVRFVMASRLAAGKGCAESIEAFARVARKSCDVSLEIYGDGPARTELEMLVATLHLSDRVTFHGHVNSAQLAEALPRCDIFIQHSLEREGSPVSIVEAMSCGLPVVATAVGGNVDLVADGSTGFIVAEKDVQTMAQSMARLAESERLRYEFGARARDRAVAFFDATVLTRRLEELVHKVSTLE